ncbi:methyltransferase [Saccharopolyspora pogona]|uniref:methyltransferase n=1 Tax=Saccharopolyspora pogona TaxID=333966 RepID=UPI001CC25E91|nr:methyltransferase [Saccharopolyspora pogona]
MMETFWDGMYSLSCYTGARLATTFDFAQVRRLLDVGGGGAAFDIELCQAHPHLQATVFDLPFVKDLTLDRVRSANLEDRIDFVAGDFFADALPDGYDAILLSNILHDWNEADVQRILATCANALAPGGHLLVCESFVNDDKSGPAMAALVSLNMLVETWGRNYTAAEYSAWIRETNLTVEGVRPLDSPGASGVLVARKPSSPFPAPRRTSATGT